MQIYLPPTKHCLFIEHDHNIWEFRFLKAHNQAVDEWVAWQNYLKNLPPKPEVTTIRTLLDFRPDGPIPMLYALQKNVEWRRQNPDVDPIPVKVAIVMKSVGRFQQSYTDLLKEGVNVFGMRKVRVEIFYDAHDKALDWLRSTA